MVPPGPEANEDGASTEIPSGRPLRAPESFTLNDAAAAGDHVPLAMG